MSSPSTTSWVSEARTLWPRFADSAVERARLSVVPRTSVQAKRTPFVVLVASVLLAGVVALLMFNTSMQQTSFTIAALESQASALRAQEQGLQMELDELRDPQKVAEQARRLGMVPMVNPAFLDLADGSVLGEAKPAEAVDAQRINAEQTRLPGDLQPRRIVRQVAAEAPLPTDAIVDGVPAAEQPANRDRKKTRR